MPRRRPKVAEPKSVRGHLKGMDSDYLLCRDSGHSWRPRTALRTREGFTRSMQCNACETIKHQDLTRAGFVLRVNYTYPQGFLIKGLGRLTGESLGMVRVETVTRELNGAIPLPGE